MFNNKSSVQNRINDFNSNHLEFSVKDRRDNFGIL